MISSFIINKENTKDTGLANIRKKRVTENTDFVLKTSKKLGISTRDAATQIAIERIKKAMVKRAKTKK